MSGDTRLGIDVTDTELLRQAQGGDMQAFGQLVRRHQSTLYRTARAIVRSPADAEDVTQCAWLQAFRKVDQFNGIASVRTWLVAIVRNQAIDHLRIRRRRLQLFVPECEMASEPASVLPSPEDVAVFNERRTRIARSLQTLPPRLRVALQLWQTGQYSYEELAEIQGVRTGTMKSRVWEARQHLRRALRRSNRRAAKRLRLAADGGPIAPLAARADGWLQSI